MQVDRSLGALFLTVTMVVTTGSAAYGQPRAEIGASLLSSTIGLGDEGVSTLGMPSGGFGILNPGMYASLFIGTRVAIEPQVGFIWAHVSDESIHFLNFVGQFDYFFQGTGQPSLYAFAAAGLVSASGADYTPKSVGFGVGYRIPLGDRLTFRVDGRYTHYTGEFDGGGGDALGFMLSIGGVFRRM